MVCVRIGMVGMRVSVPMTMPISMAVLVAVTVVMIMAMPTGADAFDVVMVAFLG